MNYYQHHIGDFDKATRHLTRIERSIYRDLLEIYYDTEAPLIADFDRLARRCIVDDCDRGAMREVLNEFFTLQDDGYHNTRADKEIDAYKRMAEGGKRGASKRWGKGDYTHPIPTPCPPHKKANANHEPITNNHEPVTNNHEPVTKSKAAPATRLPADWTPGEEEIIFCKSKRPDLNLHDVADGFRDYWIAQPGAKGRKTDWTATWRNWIRNQRVKPNATGQPYESEKDRSRRETYEAMTGRKQSEPANTNTIDAFAERVD